MADSPNYDSLDSCLELLYDYFYHGSQKAFYQMKPILKSDLVLDKIKKYSTFDPAPVLKAKMKLVRKTANIAVFKRYSAKSHVSTVKIGKYDSSNPNRADLKRPEVAAMVVSYLLSELSRPNGDRLTMLPLMNFDVTMKDLKKLNPEAAKEIDASDDDWFHVRVVEHFFSSKTLRELIDDRELSREEWQQILFQLMYVLAKIQNRYPKFRHNHLDLDHVIVYLRKPSKPEKRTFRSTEFTLPSTEFDVRIDGFSETAIDGMIENRKSVSRKRENHYYDLHYLFQSVMFHLRKKGKVPAYLERLFSEAVPKSLEHSDAASFKGLDEIAFSQHAGDIPTPINLLTRNFFFAEFISTSTNMSFPKVKNNAARITELGSERSDVNYGESDRSLTVDSDDPRFMSVVNIDEIDGGLQNRIVAKGSRRLVLGEELNDDSIIQRNDEFGLTTEMSGGASSAKSPAASDSSPMPMISDSPSADTPSVADQVSSEKPADDDDSDSSDKDQKDDDDGETESPALMQVSASPDSVSDVRATEKERKAVQAFFNNFSKQLPPHKDPRKLRDSGNYPPKKSPFANQFSKAELMGQLNRARNETETQQVISDYLSEHGTASGADYDSATSITPNTGFRPRKDRYSRYASGSADSATMQAATDFGPMSAGPMSGYPTTPTGQGQFEIPTQQQQQIMSQLPDGFEGALPDHLAQDLQGILPPQLLSGMGGAPGMPQGMPGMQGMPQGMPTAAPSGGLNSLGAIFEQGGQSGAPQMAGVGSAAMGAGPNGELGHLGSAGSGVDHLPMPGTAAGNAQLSQLEGQNISQLADTGVDLSGIQGLPGAQALQNGMMPGMAGASGMPGMMPQMPGMGQLPMAGQGMFDLGVQGGQPGMMPGASGMPMIGGGKKKSRRSRKNQRRDFFF